MTEPAPLASNQGERIECSISDAFAAWMSQAGHEGGRAKDRVSGVGLQDSWRLAVAESAPSAEILQFIRPLLEPGVDSLSAYVAVLGRSEHICPGGRRASSFSTEGGAFLRPPRPNHDAP